MKKTLLLCLSAAVLSLPNLSANQESIERGKALYNGPALCYTCHQASGAGISKIFPPLVNSEWVKGNTWNLVKILKHGLQGEIEVNGESYNSIMAPANKQGKPLENQEIADILTFIRHEFGEGASAVSENDVTEILNDGFVPSQGMLQTSELKNPQEEEKKEVKDAEVSLLKTQIQDIKPEPRGLGSTPLLISVIWGCLCVIPGITGLGRG